MKSIKTIFSSILVMTLFAGTIACLAQIPDSNVSFKNQDGSGFAVVELFTSEGCSSCPPADALLAKLQEQDNKGQLYILAYHVDYWDHQGWRDRFSDHSYSVRQQKYSEWLHLPNIYTPQLIVNGEREQIGSNANAVSVSLYQALNQPAARQLQLTPAVAGRDLTVTANLEPARGSVLVVALVQRQAESRVKAGENSGRDLAHVQIVRALKETTGKEVKIKLPQDYAQQQWEVVGFVQDKSTGKITDAARGRW
jgi:hypothetical protein